ncbi:hypothetical protein OOZ54_13110 [Rhodopseudomonas palustris]|uniref:hypothetical protein n=1 Tax=Rhodopseudomonas palustris TaxID=1076 RepID=UPI0022F07834|nr:hypothetical protein [Rhodopseudomonas palustris]WBU27615.1 hypothetical protein OOZ54_13110 [Rhodopseudomonas palustris]
MDFLVYAGIVAKRRHPTLPLVITVEEATFCTAEDLNAVQRDFQQRHATVATVRLTDPKALAVLVHTGLV